MACAVVLLLLGCSGADPAPETNDGFRATRVDAAADIEVGALRFRRGFVLRAPGLGGLSAAEVDDDASSIVALSDTGRWFRFELMHGESGTLTDIRLADQGTLRDTAGKAFATKRQGDAESMARLADERLLVGFEAESKVLVYTPDLASAATPIANPPGLGGGNSGLEAMTRLADGRLLALSEGGARRDGTGPAWIDDGQGWQTTRYAAGDGFRPTGATTLPNGDVLVLERRFSFPANLSARLVRVPLSAVDGNVIRGEEIGRVAPPLPVDNFEAVTSYERDGRQFVLILSDNNFSLLQRNLLLQLELTN